VNRFKEKQNHRELKLILAGKIEVTRRDGHQAGADSLRGGNRGHLETASGGGAALSLPSHRARWRRNQSVFGKPDFVFPKLKLAVFVDGCFWNDCPKHGTHPKNNRAFWKNELRRNKKRDRLVNRTLRARYWRVLRIWEHQLCDGKRVIRRRAGRGIARLALTLPGFPPPSSYIICGNALNTKSFSAGC
jgi:DNA mismatch endonuclease Vsr